MLLDELIRGVSIFNLFRVRYWLYNANILAEINYVMKGLRCDTASICHVRNAE